MQNRQIPLVLHFLYPHNFLSSPLPLAKKAYAAVKSSFNLQTKGIAKKYKT